jgi:GT2 family glycosyltransferase
MFTIAIPAYNNPGYTRKAIESAIRATQEIDLPTQFILIDDSVDGGESLGATFAALRDHHPERELIVVKSVRRLHYPGSFSLALHLAKTPLMLFMSNDMLLTPSYLMAVLGVAALSSSFGTIRGSSDYTDGLPQHVVKPPGPVESYEAAASFAETVLRRNGLAYVENYLFCGDAGIVRREVVEAIGVHDCELTPYFSDIDYGMRAQIAGFTLAGALGAWLHHEGAGYVKQDARRRGETTEALNAERRQRIEASWQCFRRKWSEDLPNSPFEYDFVKFPELARRRADSVAVKVQMAPEWLSMVEFL